MTPLNSLQKTGIIRRIDFLETELTDLEEYKKLDFVTYSSDRKKRREVERILENTANACIDIGKIVLAGSDVELPDTYKGIFQKLQQIGLIDKSLAEKLSDLVRLRNILAHQYLDIKWEMIKDFLDRGKKEVKTFLNLIKKSL